MKKYFLGVLLFCLVFSFYTVSALYEGEITVGVGENVQVTIGNPPSFNVTEGEECTSGQTTCVGTNYYLCVNNVWTNQGNVDGQCGYTITPTAAITGGGGGGAHTLSSVATGIEENQSSKKPSGTSPETNKTQPKETTSFTNFLTGAVTGIGDFVKTGEGIATILVLITAVVLGVALTSIRKKKLAVKEEKPESSEATG